MTIGSGTTIIAAEISGRACYAIELLGQYVDVAVERWQRFTGGPASGRLNMGRRAHRPDLSRTKRGAGHMLHVHGTMRQSGA